MRRVGEFLQLFVQRLALQALAPSLVWHNISTIKYESLMGDDTAKNGGSGDESIGRPEEWREGRYEKPGAPVDRSVRKPPGEGNAPPDAKSTKVTKKDYEQR